MDTAIGAALRASSVRNDGIDPPVTAVAHRDLESQDRGR